MRRLVGALLLVFIAAGAAGAQWTPTTIVRGDELGQCVALSTPSGPRLLVQTGHGVRALRREGDGLVVDWSAPLPVDTFIWNAVAGPGGPTLTTMSPAGVRLGVVADGKVTWGTGGGGGDVFRGRLSTAPVRRPFSAASSDAVDFIVPSLESLAWSRAGAKTTPVATLDTTARAKDDLGWGLGYRMSARVTVPWFTFADVDADGDRDVIYRAGAELRVSSAQDAAWGRAPESENTEILRFEHPVPPLAGDWDGDGRADLVLTDPGEGLVFGYRGAGRPGTEVRGPDQVMKLDGWVLSRWLVDGDGDGKLDLVLLTIPKISLLQQVGVARRRAVDGRLTLHRQDDDGGFSPAPKWRMKLELPIAVSVTRDQREIRFRAPVLPFVSGGVLNVLGPDEEGTVSIRRRTEDAWEVVTETPELLTDSGFVADPFDVAIGDLDGDGRPEMVVVIRAEEDTSDRAVVLLSD